MQPLNVDMELWRDLEQGRSCTSKYAALHVSMSPCNYPAERSSESVALLGALDCGSSSIQESRAFDAQTRTFGTY